MRLKPIPLTLLVAVLVTFAIRGGVAMLVCPALAIAAKVIECPPASSAADIAPPDGDKVPVRPSVGPLPNEVLSEIAEPETSNYPPNEPNGGKSIGTVPRESERPGEVVLEAERDLAGTYRLRIQDTDRIAEELKKRFPLLAISHDAPTKSVVIREVPPKMREAVAEVIQQLVAAQPAKPSNNTGNEKSDDDVPAVTDRPIGPTKRANVRVVPFQIQSLRAKVHVTEAYRLKNQDTARIAQELKKIVPELEITDDPATDSVIIQEMTPKMREFVTEVIRRLSAARREPMTPQPNTPSVAPARSPELSPAPPVPSRSPTPVIKRDRNEVQDEVRRTFEARQESLRKEVAEFRGRIDRLVQAIKDRDHSKAAIIERRVEELLNPNLRWDAAGNPTGGIGSSSSTGSTTRSYPLVGNRNLELGPGTLQPPRPEAGQELGVLNPQRFEIPKELEFLGQYPRFRGLSLDMTETQFRVFLEQQKLVPQLSIPQNDQLNYSVPLGDGLRLTVMFGLDGKCRGIERIGGAAPSIILPHPAFPARVRAEKVVAKIFRLEQVDAASVAKTLQELASEKPFSARISADVKSNSVIVFANPDDMPVIEAIVVRLDKAAESPSSNATSPPSDRGASSSIKPPLTGSEDSPATKAPPTTDTKPGTPRSD